MVIIYKEKDNLAFENAWKYYLNNNIVSYKYTLLNLEYFLLYSKYLINDKSFIVLEDNKCVGICFLPIEEIDNVKSVSISGGYVFSPLSNIKRIEKRIYEEIDLIANNLKIAKINFALDPLILHYTSNNFNYLLEYNFFDTSTTNCIINLKQEKEELWKNLRKSYKGLINKYLKNNEFTIEIIDSNNADYRIHEVYRELHRKCSGNVTRIKETFDKQFEMLENGLATLIALKYNDKFIGVNYFFHYKKTVIYASGADDPEYETNKIPIYHLILWNALLHFKKKEFELIEFSQPCGYSKLQGFNDFLDEKQINISNFKRAMGTQMIMSFRGEKYFQKELLLKNLENFKKKIIDSEI